MNRPDLQQAVRARTRPLSLQSPTADPTVPSIHDLAARLAAVEASVDRLHADVTTGFQEAASRAVVLADATDEVLRRIEERVGEPPVIDLSAIESGLAEVDARVAALPAEELQRALDAIDRLRSEVDLVAARLSELLGGPSLTELMDRLDEIADSWND